MKAEHRHELKTNELAAWLANFPKWFHDNFRMIIYILIVILLVSGAYFWKHYQQNVVRANENLGFTSLLIDFVRNKQYTVAAQEEGMDYSYTLIQNSNKLQEFAGTAKNNNISALALIKSAQALRTELHYHIGAVDTRTFSEQIIKAKGLYEQALEKVQDNPSLKARAMFGLGLCEEELGNFENARQIYTKIKQDPQFKGTVSLQAAEHRLLIMDHYKERLVFAARPQPELPAIDLEPFAPQIEFDANSVLPSLELTPPSGE
ncbi:MAG: hypothetical protein WCZ89_03920 [Phycisphaerae bacterium]